MVAPESVVQCPRQGITPREPNVKEYAVNYEASPYDVGDRKQVFLDWDLIEPGYGVSWGPMRSLSELPFEMPLGVRIAVHRPRIDSQPLIEAEHPWESSIIGYSTLLEEDGRFRLYYSTLRRGPGADMLRLLCYAESDDGHTWRKPRVGAVAFEGSTDNNIVYGLECALGRGAHGATVFIDPSADQAERYKMVHSGLDASERRCIFGAVSPDGLHWKALVEPLVADYECDTQTVATFDAEKGRYLLYGRSWRGLNVLHWHGRRCIAYAESETFRRFPEPQIIVAPDATYEPDTGLYTNAYTRWPGAADAHLMFPTLYHRRADVVDVHLLVSRDGLRWSRPTAQPLVPVGEPGSGCDAGVYAGCGLAELQPGQWSLVLCPRLRTHNENHQTKLGPRAPQNRSLWRAVWRADGITSLEAADEGRCTTVPLTFSGKQLQMNAWTRFGGEVRVGLLDSTHQVMTMTKMRLPEPVPGMSIEDCDPITGDAPRHVVSWKGNSDVSALAGRPIRLRLLLRRARLHSFAFTS